MAIKKLWTIVDTPKTKAKGKTKGNYLDERILQRKTGFNLIRTRPTTAKKVYG
jgi:hypothetical protein